MTINTRTSSTVTRRGLRPAIAAAATLFAIAAAPAQAFDIAAAPPADTAEMETRIRQSVSGNVFGFQYAIAQNGTIVRTSAQAPAGFAASAADTGGATGIAMQPTMRMEIMSATKTFTAISTMKLLRANGLTVESPVAPYLPPSWARGKGFETDAEGNPVRFRHLLTHTSGLNQLITAFGDSAPDTNKWDGLKTLVATGTQAGSPKEYKNANYALLRILNAELWKRSGGVLTTPYGSQLPVTKDTNATYAIDHMRKRIFEPLGINTVSCSSSNVPNAVRGYPANANQATSGSLINAPAEECAGHRGLRLSAIEMVKVMIALRHGSLLPAADRATMDQLRLGWWEDSNAADGDQFGTQDGVADATGSLGVFWHPGDATGTNQVHTCQMTFPDGTEAALIVNSPFGGQCGVLLSAWRNSK